MAEPVPIPQLAELEARGNAVFRGVFDRATCEAIKMKAEHVYQHIVGSPRPKAGANTLHMCDVAAQSERWMDGFVRSIIKAFARTEPYRAYERLFGEPVCFPLLKCVFRYQMPDYVGSYLPYHQDGARDTVRIINSWIALDDCGEDAPGLEVVNAPRLGSQEDLFAYRPLDPDNPETAREWQDNEARTLARFGDVGATRPVFRAGDAIMFDNRAMHRTYFAAGMTRARMSVEIRACSARDAETACDNKPWLTARRWPLLGVRVR